MTAWTTGWLVLDQSECAGLCNRKCRKDGCETLFNVPESPDTILKNELAAGKYRRQKAIHDNRFYCETHRCRKCENPKKAGQELCSTHCPKCKYTGCGVFIDDPAKFCANHGCSEEECRNEAMGGYRTCSSHTPKCPLGIVKCNRYQPPGDGSVYCRLHECRHEGCHRAQLVDPDREESQRMLGFCKGHYDDQVRKNHRRS